MALGLSDDDISVGCINDHGVVPSTPELANYARCVSGAFHNLAGTLYQDGKYAAAVRFLRQGCVLGRKALSIHETATVRRIQEKGEEGWKLLKEQLFRRWELLGICNAKMGDRRVSSNSLFTY